MAIAKEKKRIYSEILPSVNKEIETFAVKMRDFEKKLEELERERCE